MIKDYYHLTKPGIIYGNAVSAIAGFFLASKGHIDWHLFFAMLVGLSLIIASGCVFNNFLDRDIDDRMDRTKNRVLVKGIIPGRNAIIFASVLGILGAWILGHFTNFLAAEVALSGLFVYVAIYTPLKRKTVFGTLIGAVAGAVPPVVGYTAISHTLDRGAWILFFILVFWQMPHFYAIAIYRLKDYATAMIPVMPVKQGIKTTKVYMLIYTVGFVVAASLLTFYKYTSFGYLAVALLLGLSWVWFCIKGFWTTDDTVWAKKMFRYSLIVLLVLSITISIDSIIKNRI